MGPWRQIRRGLSTLLRRDEADRDIADEVGQWFAEAEADLVSGGATPEEARRAVRQRYGDAATVREDVRAYGWENLVETLLADLRYGARRLRGSPGFTLVAIVTVGLAVGSATAIFSVVRPVLFAPLPYLHADRVVSISDLSTSGDPVPVTFGTYREVEARSRSFEALAVSKPWRPALTGRGDARLLEGELVSADYFRVLGVAPAWGPGFDVADDRPVGPDVVVLSDALWRNDFGADTAIVGRQVHLDGRPFTVVGVMPNDFENVPGHPARLWSLLQYDASLPSFDGREWGHHLELTGRLRPGASNESARAELDEIAAHPVPQLARPAWADLSGGLGVRGMVRAATAGVRPALLALLGAAVLLLGIACLNVTNLALARGARRRGEMAVRAALGAAHGRVARQLVTESLLLAALGGILGIVVASFGVEAVLSLSPVSLPRLDTIRLDGSAFAFALGVTAFVGVLAGLAPAFATRGGDLHRGLRWVSSRGGAGHLPTRRALVVAEVALALVLLVGAGLLVRSMQHVLAVSPGFDPAHRLVMKVQASGARFDDGAYTNRFFAQALDAVRRVPGVRSSALTSQLPLSGDAPDSYGMNVEDDPRPEGMSHAGYRYTVSPGYFRSLGIPLLLGRLLEEGDVAGAPRVVVVSDAFARSAFPDQDPLGRRVRAGSPREPWYTIVGVVGDVKQPSLGDTRADAFYVTPEQWYFADQGRWFVVDARGDGRTLIPALARAVRSVDPDQPVVRVATMEELVSRSEAQRRFAMAVLEAFALLALVLAGVGLYGVLSGTVNDRLREIGVRAALGASRERMVGLVVRQGMTLTAIGAVLGLAAAALVSRLVDTLLFGVSRLDPLTYVGVVAVLVGVSALACWVPALRAARVDPVATLRAE